MTGLLDTGLYFRQAAEHFLLWVWLEAMSYAEFIEARSMILADLLFGACMPSQCYQRQLFLIHQGAIVHVYVFILRQL